MKTLLLLPLAVLIITASCQKQELPAPAAQYKATSQFASSARQRDTTVKPPNPWEKAPDPISWY